MFRHKFKLSQSLLIPLLLAISTSLASADACKISANPETGLRIPIALSEQVSEIESLDIKISFDKDALKVTKNDVTLTGDILNDENYTLTVNPDIEGELTLIIYSIANLSSGSGELLSIDFDVIGNPLDASVLSLTNFTANTSPASGGFHLNDTFCQCAQATVLFDTNNDGRTGMEEAIHALQCLSGTKICNPNDMGLRHAIYALRIVSGIKDLYHDTNNDYKTGMEEAIHALQCISGTNEECYPEDTGLEHAIYTLMVVSGMRWE
ncbi:MAG: hypothetical protein B6245_18600 [Desulfobacteraceae bacterium 4572_88]|nr:MAG: hypothetical protein B6245_18600 [Desulfobacteraceae bacterium 4572_88]